jgi:uncharacterized protein (DUF433 family)
MQPDATPKCKIGYNKGVWRSGKEVMMGLQEIETQLRSLSEAEKAQVFKVLSFDLTHTWPGIEKTPDVAGGEACIVRTRIPVWVLEGYRRLGWSEARLLENYPTLRAADLVNAWAYADAHPEEMERAIHLNAEA